jgi:hypothetical protein
VTRATATVPGFVQVVDDQIKRQIIVAELLGHADACELHRFRRSARGPVGGWMGRDRDLSE